MTEGGRLGIRPTQTFALIAQFCIILTIVGVILRQYEYLLLAIGTACYLLWLMMRFQRATRAVQRGLSVSRTVEKRISHAEGTCKVLLIVSTAESQCLRIEQLEDVRRFNGVEEREVLTINSGPLRPIEAEYLLRFSTAGIVEFDRTLVTFRDDRGLFTRSSAVESPGNMDVDIPAYQGRRVITPMLLYGGSPNRRSTSPSGTEYASTRAYVPGDELRRVEWKASARLQKLMIRQFHTETMGAVVALLDGRSGMLEKGFVASRFEEGLAITRLVARTTLETGGTFGFGIMKEDGLAEHWLPEQNRSRIDYLRKLALEQQRRGSGQSVAVPREPITRHSISIQINRLQKSGSDTRAATLFLQLLKNARVLLVERFKRNGPFRSIRFFSDSLAHPAFILVLTDLQGQQDELLEGLKQSISRGHKPILVQVGAPWRLASDLEQGYEMYVVNSRVIKRFREEGVQVLDIKPQRLLDSLLEELARETR